MAIKIDLEKAYDKLNWNFIGNTLEDIDMLRNFINLIWHCISSTSVPLQVFGCFGMGKFLMNFLHLEESVKATQFALLFCALY